MLDSTMRETVDNATPTDSRSQRTRASRRSGQYTNGLAGHERPAPPDGVGCSGGGEDGVVEVRPVARSVWTFTVTSGGGDPREQSGAPGWSGVERAQVAIMLADSLVESDRVVLAGDDIR
jgi:hypothetical protein